MSTARHIYDRKPTKVGIVVRCTYCGMTKKPHGRSAPLGINWCTRDCPGYVYDPQVGCLWPGETDVDFGFECCDACHQTIHGGPMSTHDSKLFYREG